VVAYSKKFLPINDQLNLLRSRGLYVSDETKAEMWLGTIGYYRLSGYFHPFLSGGQEVVPKDADAEKPLDTFVPGTRFEEIVEIYLWDSRLRKLMLTYLEPVEIKLKTEIALKLGVRSPYAHLEPKYLHGNFTKKVSSQSGLSPHQMWVFKHIQKIADSSEQFVPHFREKYEGQIPIWVAVELMDFGGAGKLLQGMSHDDRSEIALAFGAPTPRVLDNWMAHLNQVRNISAHHSRLWNRKIQVVPSFKGIGDVSVLAKHLLPEGKYLIGGSWKVVDHISSVTSQTSGWSHDLRQLVLSLPESNVSHDKAIGLNVSSFLAGSKG
jgi:abortive infection bacteriophage resistance protein